MKLYRGFNNNYPNLGVRPEQKGIWMTEDEEYAKEYADMFKNGAIAEIELDDDYISLASENDCFEIFGDDFDELGGDVEWDNEVCGILKEKGYDGFVFDDYGVYCYYIFNRDLIKGYKIIKTFKNNREDAMESLYEGLANKPVSFTAYHGGVEPDMTPDEGRAFYLTDDYDLAYRFARREVYDDGLYEGEIPTVFTFKGTFNNPYYLTDDEYDSEGQDSNIDYKKWVEMGVDGLVYEGHTTYYIVIDLSTIKLVDKKVFEDEAILDESVILKEDIAAVQKYFPKIHPSDFNNLINYDPTYKGGNELGKYGKWILSLYNNYIKDDIAHKKWEDQKNQGNNYPEPIRKSSEKLEDFEKLPELLRQYDVINDKVKNDISNIKSISDLYSFVNTHKSQGISDNSKVNHAKDLVKKSVKNGGEIVFQDNNWIVLIPETLKSSVVFGEDTNWCTTSPNGDMYNGYKDRYGGDYFINVNLTNGDLYQFHFESNQYMDSTDKEINIVDFLNNNQDLFNFYKNYFKDSLIDKSSIGIIFIDNPTEEEQLKAVGFNFGRALQYIKNPSEKVQMYAILHSPDNIRYIKNPSEEIQLKAIELNPCDIMHIKNPCEQAQIEAVKYSSSNIMYIENPSEQIQLKVVKKDGKNIYYISNPSEKVKLAAVKQDCMAIEYIKNPSEQVQLASVKQAGMMIRYIKNPSEQVQIVAVKQNEFAIDYIKKPTEKVQLEAIKEVIKRNYNIEDFIKNFIKNPTPKVKEYVEKMKNVKESKIPSLRVDEKKFKSSIFNVLLESNILTEDIEAVKKYFPKVPEEKIQTLIELDPTYQGGDNLGKFGKWILGLYNKGQLKDEDFYKVPQYLTTFKDNLKKIQNKDIMSYKTLPDLAQAIQPYEGQKDVSKKQQVKQLKSDEAEKVLDNSTWLIVHPKTHKADCYYGANTKWCTASKDDDTWFSNYNEKGPLFVLINKKNGKKYQFHFESLSFMDELDRPVSPSDVINNQEASEWFIEYCQDHLPVIIENYNEDAYNEIYDNGSYSISMSVNQAIDNVMYTEEKTLFDTDELASWYDDSKTAFEFWNGTIRNYLKDNPEFHEECEEAVVEFTDENAFISDIHTFLKEGDLYANKEFQWQLYRNLGDLFDKIYGSKIEELWQEEYGHYDVDGGSFYIEVDENEIVNQIFERGEIDTENLTPYYEGSYDYYDLDKDFQKAMEKTIIQTIKDWTKSENQLEFKFDESVKNWKNPFLED